MARNVITGRTAQRQKIQQHLRDSNFKELFVEELGWDVLKEPPLTILIESVTYVLRPLVEKRGVKVFICDPDASGHIHEPGQLDGDPKYLTNRLKRVQQERGEDQFHTFYRYFLLKLFHEGLSQRDRTPELEELLGNVPYLNGGLFDIHVLERINTEINIPDAAFEKLFAFFDEFDWHLDDRPLHNDREINPDVLGYIFEKYINQKQMGAYYTKEDITEYISKNTILPFLLDATEQKCLIAFRPDGPVWVLLRENPDVYIYEAVKKGCEMELPPEIEAGVHDVAQRGEWNKPASGAYALPTETWREVVARRTRYKEIRTRLMAAQITSVNDLITSNLDIRHFAEDVITYCTSTDLLRALYESISQVTVLDPTCGSGAFLFAALNILEGLYEACLERMQDLVEEREALDATLPAEKRRNHPDLIYFRSILEQARQHPNRAYFIYKSIIINNLYGVDIMEEATEICKLRLFLKLVSQIERFDDIEPLPDIDFNIRAGNTLVGFASYEETKQALEGRAIGKGGAKGEVVIQNQMIFDDRIERIEQKAQEIERAFEHFRKLQTMLTLDSGDMAANKQQLRRMLETLRVELDGYLASEQEVAYPDIFPKYSDPLAESILAKMNTPALGDFEVQEYDQPIYIYRIIGYFVKAVDFIPYFWNKVDGEKKSEDYKPFHFEHDIQSAILAILNSSLFYWFWLAHGDAFHCGYKDVRSFRVGNIRGFDRLATLQKLGQDLMFDLQKNATCKVVISKTTGRVEYDEFNPSISLGIMNAIDEVLSKHYGFTDEEPDFIINYDIKYPMGRESVIEEEE